MTNGTLLNRPQTNPVTRRGDFILKAASLPTIKALLEWSSSQNAPINLKLRDGKIMTLVASSFENTRNATEVAVNVHATLENNEFSMNGITDVFATTIPLSDIESAEPFSFVNI